MIQRASIVTIFIILIDIPSMYCIPNCQFSQKYREVRNTFGPNLEISPIYNYAYIGINKTRTTSWLQTRRTSVKKWQVGRVSRKQYEIINMLWRKTKIFVDLESTTHKPGTKMSNNDKKLRISLGRPGLSTPTVSYIEFCYLEENDDNMKKEKSENARLKYSNNLSQSSYKTAKNIKRNLGDSSFMKWYGNDLLRSKIPQTLSPHSESAAKFRRDSVLQNMPFQRNKLPINKSKLYQSKKYATNKYDSNLVEYLRKYFLVKDIADATTLYETCPYTTTASTRDMNASSDNVATNFKTVSKSYDTTVLTKIYDKIRFFEIYDRNTDEDNASYINGDANGIGNIISPQYFNYSVDKIKLEHVDENIGHHNGSHKSRFVKKHISENDLTHNTKDVATKFFNSTSTLKFVAHRRTQKELNVSLRHGHEQKLFHTTTWHTFRNSSKEASWSDYPFAAAYIYEPFQVRCDAAGISPHWLITSASCLSRHRLHDPLSAGRSPFVAYCGVNWRQPERVAYVKFSLTHPKYNPSEERKYTYNIGLIKVVSSMSSCNGWSPVSLMSHQYTANQEDSVAAAVGWGLDRYVPRQNKVPYCPLMVYESRIFTDSCPGNYGYSEAKRSGVFNIHYVYCLSLPPYYAEKYDPVHGSLLLVGGKLIALYLQEERRPWGEQSALYTSIWRLIPWVHEVAQEPELDAFIVEI